MIRAATLDVALILRHEDFELLKSIVRNFVPLSSVIIYGSRCNGTARDTSDIDLLILDSSITPLNVSELREQLDESNIDPALICIPPPSYRIVGFKAFCLLECVWILLSHRVARCVQSSQVKAVLSYRAAVPANTNKVTS
jgi:predicted nucleotidyltransferase